MRREGFLKLAAGVVLAPYLGKFPSQPVPATVPATSTTLVLHGTQRLSIGDILRVPSSGEALRVNSVAHFKDMTEISVTRGIGLLSPKPIPVGEEPMVIGRSA